MQTNDGGFTRLHKWAYYLTVVCSLFTGSTCLTADICTFSVGKLVFLCVHVSQYEWIYLKVKRKDKEHKWRTPIRNLFLWKEPIFFSALLTNKTCLYLFRTKFLRSARNFCPVKKQILWELFVKVLLDRTHCEVKQSKICFSEVNHYTSKTDDE